MSVAACPPAPTAAMFSFSLGDTRRGFAAARTKVVGSNSPEPAAEVA
jgi:hypothetical protein